MSYLETYARKLFKLVQSSNRQKTTILFMTIVSFLLFFFQPISLAEEVTEAWIRRYDALSSRDNRANAIAIDKVGNVYVTGGSKGEGSSWDYVTIKYDLFLGNELWIKRYNGLGNSDDSADAIALDRAGNVYVTGSSIYGIYENGIRDYDYATIKYDSSGNEIWTNRYDAQWYTDKANAITVDKFGNTYVAGESFVNETGSDYATIKYDANGNELWVKRYNGLGDNDDSANAIALDRAGNVYVAGDSGYGYASGRYSDYATIKYDANGNELWVKRYNGLGNNSDRVSGISINKVGDIYVTGYSYGDSTSGDYATIKYDANGNELWVKRYNGSMNSDDYPVAIALDEAGNIYITGYSDINGGYSDYATIKYDANGNELWVKRYNGLKDDYATALALDKSGNVYVTGESFGSGTEYDYATIKYDTNGNELWVRRYNGPRYNWDSAKAIAVDRVGNVYVTGSSTRSGMDGSGTYSDYTTIKYAKTTAIVSTSIKNKRDKRFKRTEKAKRKIIKKR